MTVSHYVALVTAGHISGDNVSVLLLYRYSQPLQLDCQSVYIPGRSKAYVHPHRLAAKRLHNLLFADIFSIQNILVDIAVIAKIRQPVVAGILPQITFPVRLCKAGARIPQLVIRVRRPELRRVKPLDKIQVAVHTGGVAVLFYPLAKCSSDFLHQLFGGHNSKLLFDIVGGKILPVKEQRQLRPVAVFFNQGHQEVCLFRRLRLILGIAGQVGAVFQSVPVYVHHKGRQVAVGRIAA